MKIKRLLGFCECPGCMKHAKKELTIMRKTDKVKISVRVMKKYIAAGLVIALMLSMSVQAKRAYIEPLVGDPFIEPCKIRCTCYCEHGKTGTGKKKLVTESLRGKRNGWDIQQN